MVGCLYHPATPCLRLPRFGGEGMRWGGGRSGGVLRGCHELAVEFSIRASQAPCWNSLENSQRLGYLTYSAPNVGGM